MAKHDIRIGGVPEHFNLPWHLAIENGDFKKRGVSVQWKTYSGGTGEMTNALRKDEIDLCVLLTEGIITDIIHGNPSKIISQYIITPLIWGVHTAAHNSLESYDEAFDKKIAISRFGSGSHLMPIVDANGKNRRIDQGQFVVVKNLENALSSLKKLETDVFYWEKYTTKPWVDSGELRRIGEYLTPWPCFMIAASDKILRDRPDDVIRVLRTIHDVSDSFMQSNRSIDLVAQRYSQKLSDVERWFNSTEWAIHGWVSDKMVRSVIYHLKIAGIVDKNQPIPELIWKR